jgi:hypothetical protein
MGLQVQESLPADWTLLVWCLPCYGYSCLLHTTGRMDITHWALCFCFCWGTLVASLFHWWSLLAPFPTWYPHYLFFYVFGWMQMRFVFVMVCLHFDKWAPACCVPWTHFKPKFRMTLALRSVFGSVLRSPSKVYFWSVCHAGANACAQGWTGTYNVSISVMAQCLLRNSIGLLQPNCWCEALGNCHQYQPWPRYIFPCCYHVSMASILMIHGHLITSCKDEHYTMHHSDFSDVNCPPYTELVWCKCTSAFEDKVNHVCAA